MSNTIYGIFYFEGKIIDYKDEKPIIRGDFVIKELNSLLNADTTWNKLVARNRFEDLEKDTVENKL